MAIVRVSTDRLVELVDDLLDVARLEAGQVEIRRQPTDVGELVDGVAQLLSARLDAAGQTFTAEVPGDLPPALVDPGRLRQVLVNLLTNAHLYTGDGGRLGGTVAADGPTLVLRVWDTGRGMDAEAAAHAFDRFYRGREHGGAAGTGLGLSIVRSLVELHRGTVAVRSAPGEGSEFEVRLPQAVARSARPDGAARKALAGKHVLVIDDEPAIARLIAAQLERVGVRTTTAHSGAAAMSALREQRFDGVTLDILMPGMTGFEVLRALRADPALHRMPVVVVSVFSGREALRGEWVVRKPIEEDVLADALGAAVVAGRARVLAVGGPGARPRLDEALDALGIAHAWAADPDDVAEMCAARRYEVALVDAALERPEQAIAALHLRGRRLRRAVLVFSADGTAPAYARLDADRVAVADAGAAVLGLLAPDAVDVPTG
jgi:CheY-like chemotaxis protein